MDDLCINVPPVSLRIVRPSPKFFIFNTHYGFADGRGRAITNRMSLHALAVVFSTEMGDLLIMGTGFLLVATLLRAILPAIGLASRSAARGTPRTKEV